jgi:hypothetical protein
VPRRRLRALAARHRLSGAAARSGNAGLFIVNTGWLNPQFSVCFYHKMFTQGRPSVTRDPAGNQPVSSCCHRHGR